MDDNIETPDSFETEQDSNVSSGDSSSLPNDEELEEIISGDGNEHEFDEEAWQCAYNEFMKNIDKDEDNREQDSDSDKKKRRESRHEQKERRAEERQKNGDKEKNPEKESKSAREKFMSALKKGPALIGGMFYAIAGILRQILRTFLFGPTYARNTEEETGKKLDDLLNSEKVKKENEDREKEKSEHEKERGDRDRGEQERDKREREEEEEDRRRQQEESHEEGSDKEGENHGEEEKTDSDEEHKDMDEPEEETENGDNREDEHKDIHEHEIPKEEEGKSVHDILFGENKPQSGMENGPDKSDKDENGVKMFSVDKMSANDIQQLLETDHAKNALKSISESFGVELRFSDDMSHISLVKTDAELVETMHGLQKFLEFKDSDVSRPIDTASFLKGDITQIAVACKDIGCALEQTEWREPITTGDVAKGVCENADKRAEDAGNILAAAMITAKFRQETMQDYQADGVHKDNRDKVVLAYMPKNITGDNGTHVIGSVSPITIFGDKDKDVDGQQYNITGIKILDGNKEDFSEDGYEQVLSCESIDKVCNNLALHGGDIMGKIEAASDFPEQRGLSFYEVCKLADVVKDISSGNLADKFITCHPQFKGREDEVKEAFQEMSSRAVKLVSEQKLGLTDGQLKEAVQMIETYDHIVAQAIKIEHEAQNSDLMDEIGDQLEDDSAEHDTSQPDIQSHGNEHNRNGFSGHDSQEQEEELGL